MSIYYTTEKEKRSVIGERRYILQECHLFDINRIAIRRWTHVSPLSKNLINSLGWMKGIPKDMLAPVDAGD